MQRSLACLMLVMAASGAGAQSSISLEDLGIVPMESLSLAAMMRGCLADAALCSSAQGPSFGLDAVVNLGIVDRGAAPADPSTARSADPAGAAAATNGAPQPLPSIDISAYLTGAGPAVDASRRSELTELADLLASDDLSGFDITLIVTESGPSAAEDRAREIAAVLEQSLAGRVRVVAETGATAGITLALAPGG